MQTILELQKKREYHYKELVFLKDDIQQFLKNPSDDVNPNDLVFRYGFILRQIENLDFKLKSIFLSQIQSSKLDLKNLETMFSLIPAPFDVKDLPSYPEIFK